MAVHFPPSYFANPQHPITVAVIGCGGTGSHLLPRLASLHYSLLQFGLPGLHVTCYDDDIVEEHNIGRQNFYHNDIGCYKAFQMISKINMTYGFEWDAVTERYDTQTQPTTYNVIITCVDTVSVRHQLSTIANDYVNYIDHRTPLYWLDCGNGKDFGQVVLGTLSKIQQPDHNDIDTVSTLKNIVDIYGNLTQYNNQETQGIESCSFIESLAKQDLFINDEIAINCAKILRRLISSLYLETNGCVINQDKGQTISYNI